MNGRRCSCQWLRQSWLSTRCLSKTNCGFRSTWRGEFTGCTFSRCMRGSSRDRREAGGLRLTNSGSTEPSNQPSSSPPSALSSSRTTSSSSLGSSAYEQELSWLGVRPSWWQICLFASPTRPSLQPQFFCEPLGSSSACALLIVRTVTWVDDHAGAAMTRSILQGRLSRHPSG